MASRGSIFDRVKDDDKKTKRKSLTFTDVEAPNAPKSFVTEPPVAPTIHRDLTDIQTDLTAAKRERSGLLNDFGFNAPDLSEFRADLNTANSNVNRFKSEKLIEEKVYQSDVKQDTFTGQFGANKTMGRLTQNQSRAWNEYLKNPTPENRETAQSYDKAIEDYAKKNKIALDDQNVKLGIISQSYANYLPQQLDQLKAQAPGAVIGGAAGLLAGNPVAGAKIGASITSGADMFEITRGAAFKRLIDLGIDEETARALATDEGIVQGLIEGGDTYLDWTLFGGKALATKLLPGLSAKASSAAGKSALAKAIKQLGGKLDNLPTAVKVAGAYGLNVPQEGGEESLQEIVSIANDQRALSGQTGIGNLMKGSFDVGKTLLSGGDIITGYDEFNRPIMASDQVKQAGLEGMKIAAVSGGMQAVAGYAAQRTLTPKATKTTETPKSSAAPAKEQATVSPAASHGVQQVQAQAQVTKAQNPEAEVLDAATTLFTQQGMNLKTAQKRAEIVGKLVRGEEVSDKDLNRIDPTSNQTKQIFTQLTGVQFPEEKIQIEKLRDLYRSAHTVAEAAKVTLEEQEISEIQPLSDEQILERAKQVRQATTPETDAQAARILAQARGEIAPDNTPLLSYKDFSARHKQVFPDASPQETARMYDLYLKENQTVSFMGRRVSRRKLMETLRSAPDGDKLTEEELNALFDLELEQQRQDGKDATEHSVRNKEANYGKREDLVHSGGLSGQTVQSSRGEHSRVSGETRRAEGDGGAGRGSDESGSGSGPRVRSSADGLSGRSVREKVSDSDILRRVTLPGNTEADEITEEYYTPEMRAQVEKFAPLGAKVHFLLRGYPIPGTTQYAGGIAVMYGSNRDIYLQATSRLGVDKLADHELVHVAIADDPSIKEPILDTVQRVIPRDELAEMVRAYRKYYGSAYADSKALVRELFEEIAADAYAGINSYGVNAAQYQDAIRAVVDPWVQTRTATYRAETALTDDAGNLVVESDDQGHSRFSMSTYQESGRDILTQWMARAVVEGDLTQEDADDIVNTLDLVYDICEEARGEYAPFDAWSEAKVVVNEDGSPVFSVVKANGDYAMNLDFSLVCKKRRTLDAVLNELVRRGFVDNLALNEKQIVKINDLIRSYGFETACDLCFVDAKRYRQGKVADDFVKLYNDLVLSMVPKNSGLQPQYFNFGNSTLVTNDGAGIHELPDAELDFTKIEKVLATKGEKTVEYKTAMLLKNSPADRKLTMRGDFLSTRGFDAINRKNPRVLKLFNSKKGSGGPKSAVSDVQYLNEVLTSKTFTPEKAYAVGGVRIQSFSDYVPRMVFDYVQMIADLAAKKLPAHAYTKEELFVKQFGLTGMKINMSLIPKVVDGGIAPGLDANGNYVWADESFDFEEAKKIQNAEGYSRNCGTIAVGVSDEHIRTLMADPEIRMVIPYHKSGLSPIVAKLNKIDRFVNYTDFQNTRRPNGKHGTKLNKDVAADKKLLSEMPDFNSRMRELGDPRAAAEEYVRWCEEHDLLPKFDQFAYKQIDGVVVEKDGQRVVDENYYKLLEDFTVYDNGEYVEQSGLTMTFPNEDSAFGSMKELIKRGLKEDAILEGKRDKKVPEIVNEIMKFSVAANNLNPTSDPVIRYSISDADYMAAVERGDMETAQKMVDQAASEAFKDSVLRDKDGNLIKVYHGSSSKFNVFRGKEHGSAGNYFSPWKSFAEQYGDTRAFYLDLTNPVHYDFDFNVVNDVSEAESDGFIYLPEDMEDGIDQSQMGDTEIVVYDSDKIKSADPVTYDDNGNVIPLSERFKTDNPDIRYSITPQFEKWYKETYGTELTSAQLKRRLQTAERRAAEAEHDKKAAELKNTIDSEMDLTAWMIHHTKKMREQKRASDAKLAEARKAKTEAVRTAVAETKEIERAKAEVQHDADRMAERRNAAKRLHTKENVYTNKVTEMKENHKLKRNAAKATLRDSKLAAKRRAEIEAEQGVVDTIRKNPAERAALEKELSLAEKLRVWGRDKYAKFVSQAASIERFGKRQTEGIRADTLVNIAGASLSTVETTFKDGLVDRAGNRIGDSMSDVFLCWDEKHKKVNEGQQALLQDFMLHWHNIDRMSIVARAESALETFELNHEWLRDMDPKEFARLTAMTEKELEKNGQYEAQQQAFEYARLIRAYNDAANKPIFADDKGNSVTAETSQRIIDQYLEEHPWLLEKANGIYEWWDLFMREWAVGDTISEAEYERMHTMYPHYVPTYRADKNGVGGANFVGAGGASVSKAVKKAKGSHSEVMNIEDSFSNIVSKIIRLNRVNELYMNIIDTAMLDNDGLFSDMAYFDWDSSWQSGEYGKALLDGELTETVDDAVTAGLEDLGDGEFKLTGWLDGRKYTAFISKDLYKSIGNVTGYLESENEKLFIKAGNTLTGPMKSMITGYNPFFAIRNLVRDYSTGCINSISGLAFPKYYARAWKEMAKGTDHWQTFKALGGTHATYYNNNSGFGDAMSQTDGVIGKTKSALGFVNNNTESATRFAEYLATIDRLGDTYENRLKGIKNSAEVTVDFSRKGSLGKGINAWVSYWNPAVQGIDKTIRSLIDSPDGSAIWKQASRTLGRAAMSTVLWEAVQYALLAYLDRDDEWEELDDRTKDTYYCIPLRKSKTFLKVPKNREWGAILGASFSRMLQWAGGREDPFENYIETCLEPNFLPPALLRLDEDGGLTSDIIGVSQALDLQSNKDFAGRTIVPYAYQQGTKKNAYDADTSVFSIALGQLIGKYLSPMQIDYIISDYCGDFGDLFILATAKSSWAGEGNAAEKLLKMVRNPFIADARYSNYDVNSYYELTEELGKVVQDKKNQLGNEKYKETIEYQTQKALDIMYGDQISELNRYVRDLPDGDEKDAVKAQIAQLAGDATEFYEDSMAGKVSNPIRTAEYHDFSETVSKELIRMDAFSGDYKFVPYDVPKSKYNDPDDEKNREYILTDEQKAYFKQLYREKYNEIFEDLIQSSKYKKKKDSEKAELLEDARDDVLDATKEEFFEWLDDTGVRSTKKQK